MSAVERYTQFVTAHSRVVIAVFLVATLLVGSAAADVDLGLLIASSRATRLRVRTSFQTSRCCRHWSFSGRSGPTRRSNGR